MSAFHPLQALAACGPEHYDDEPVSESCGEGDQACNPHQWEYEKQQTKREHSECEGIRFERSAVRHLKITTPSGLDTRSGCAMTSVMTTVIRSNRGRPRSELRDAIYDFALGLFREQGFARTSVDE